MTKPTKAQLRATLTEAGIAYPAKANVEALTALLPAYTARDVTPTQLPEPPAAEIVLPEFITDEVLLQQRIDTFAIADGKQIADMHCPACGIDLGNGVLHYTDTEANGSRTYHELGMDREWECMGCGSQFGAVVPPYTPAPASTATGTGLKIEKDREERNGIKRPSVGGKCRAVWDALDAHAVLTGEDPSSKDVKVLAEAHGWNPNNASIEFYQWRKFNGITGRAAKVAPTPPSEG